MRALDLFIELTKTQALTVSLVQAVSAGKGADYVAGEGLHYPLSNRGFWNCLDSLGDGELVPFAIHLCTQLEVSGHRDLRAKCFRLAAYLRKRKLLQQVMVGFTSRKSPAFCNSQQDLIRIIEKEVWTNQEEKDKLAHAYWHICRNNGFSIADIRDAIYMRSLELWEQGIYHCSRRPYRVVRRVINSKPSRRLLEIASQDTSGGVDLDKRIRTLVLTSLGSGRPGGESAVEVYRAVRAAVRQDSFEQMYRGFRGRSLLFWKLVVEHLEVHAPEEIASKYPTLHRILSQLTHLVNGSPLLTLYAVFDCSTGGPPKKPTYDGPYPGLINTVSGN